jgi:P-type Mg2+ transporter
VALALPFTLLGHWFDFAAPSAAVLFAVGGITAGYLIAAQLLKRLAAGD